MTATQPRNEEGPAGCGVGGTRRPVDSGRTWSPPPGRSPHHGLSCPVRRHVDPHRARCRHGVVGQCGVHIAETESAWSLFQRQLMWVAIGAIVMLGTMRVDYHRWRILAAPSIVGCGVLLVVVLIPGVGLSANGATRWLGVGPFTMQPSELLKFAIVLFAADLLGRPGRPLSTRRSRCGRSCL